MKCRVHALPGSPGRQAITHPWLAPLFAAARERPDLASALAAMVAGYPGQHWLGQDPHRQTRPPINVLEGVGVPTLVAVGERDVPGFREMSAVLARRIPGAAYHVVPDAGHMVSMERPAAINDLLIRFAREQSWDR
jgi:pimeloyl-ACP methyl ester carboxylesterase